MSIPTWNKIKEFYKENFGIDNWVVEIFANQDILVLCASGTSNKTISNFIEVSEKEIKEVIKQTFLFDGWEQDLPINPYGYYCSLIDENGEVIRKKFMEDLDSKFQHELSLPKIDTALVYRICQTMWELENKINDEWI
jgi:hypothetical protein